MRDHTAWISNSIAAALVAGLTFGLWVWPPVSPALPAGPGGPPVEVSLSTEPEAPTPEPVKSEPPPAPAVAEPEPPIPPPPPPQMQMEPEKPADEPPKPVEMLHDEDGEASRVKELKAATQEINSAFGACVLKKAVYPSTKEARKLKPHGTVALRVSVADGVIAAIEISKSSGSPILDQAARATVLNSNCGALVGSGVVVGELQY